MGECKTKGCTKKVYKNGLCEKHYQELGIDASTTPANKEAVKAVDNDVDVKASVKIQDIKTSMGIQLEAFLVRAARSAGGLVSTYRNLTKLGAGDAGEIYLKKAYAYEKKGQYDKAASFMQKVIELKPEDAAAYCKLGFYYENIGMNKEAIDAYNKAIKLDAHNLDAHYRLGILYSRNDSHNEAMTHLKKARELGPEYAEVHYRLGIIFDKKKKYSDAIQCFNKAVEIDSFNIRYYKSLGFTYDSKGMHDESVACFKKAVELEEG